MSQNDNTSNFQISSPSVSDLIKMSKSMMAGDSHIIYSTLTIDGKEILSDSNFDVFIRQKMGVHDQFEINCPTEALEGYGGYPLSQTRNYLGKSITIELKQFGKSALVYEGTISGLRHKKFDGYEGHIIISGSAPMILLENGPNCQSFEDKSLRSIFDQVFQGYPQDLINMNGIPAGLPSLNERIAFSVQYKESDFAFLSRMANRFGEWFYYNGQQIVLGSAGGKIVDLVEEQGLYEFELSMKIAPQKFTYTSYNEKSGSGSLANSASESLQDGINPFQNFAVAVSENMYGKIPLNHINQSLDSNEFELRNLAKRQKAARQNVVMLEGRSNDPNLALGDRAKITAYMPDNKLAIDGEVPVESYKVIEISHHYDGLDGYYNTFTGIPYASISHLTDEEATPMGEEQSAVVVENNDPNGLGRVRVQFEWQKRNGQKTPWIRMVQGHAGSGKGSYFVPEIGEEVLVGFEGRNAEKPVVLGTQYNGKEISGFHTAGNDQKVIQTRSGTKIVMNDASGSVFIEDPSGNCVFLDGQGNIKVDAPNDITLNAGNNLDVNVGNNMTFNVGNQALLNIMQKMMVNTPFLTQMISEMYHTQAGKALINSENEIRMESPEMYLAGQKKLLLHSDESAVMNSLQTVEVNGQEGNKFSNLADKYVVVNPSLDAKCIVQLRPRDSWKGEFGFDWFRIGDTGIDGDVNYESIVGQYYDKALADVTKQRNIDHNTWTRFFKADPQPTGFTVFEKINRLKMLYGIYDYSLGADASGLAITKNYYKPVIALLPRMADPSNPRKFIETGLAKLKLYLEFQKDGRTTIKPDRIVFEMDNTLMDATHPLISIDKHTIDKADLSSEIDIELTCKLEFNVDKDITIWAITLDEAGTVKTKLSAGILKVIAPSKRQVQEIVIVRIKTSASVGTKTSLNEFNRNLKQALIKVNVIESSLDSNNRNRDILLDLSVPAENINLLNFNTEFSVNQSDIRNTDGISMSLEGLLTATLERDYPGQFTNHFKLFFLNNTCNKVTDANGSSSSTAGYSQRNTQFGIMFSDHSRTTIAHECLHGLGLPHTFSGNSYLYKAQKTENVMDYSHLSIDKATGATNTPLDRFSTWYWQWKIINRNIL